MIKVIPDNAWGPDTFPAPELVKAAATGISGYDLVTLIKRAGHPLADWVKRNPPKPGETYVHSIGLGSTEKVGQNRNSDRYGERMLERDHPTFEKYARWYLNHKNSDPAKGYGVVKKAFWNPDMGRVELITALNGTKEAADRNGGLVAERTLNKLAAGVDVAVSQSCRVPGDFCTGCENFARNRAEYCTAATCKYGGCRDNLGRVFEDGHQLGVDNRTCLFFDISDVSDTRGADRTAFVTGKVAGHYVPGGAELAELLGLVPPEHILTPASLAQLRCLRKLADFRGMTAEVRPLAWSQSLAVREKLATGPVRRYRHPDSDPERHRLLGELAADGVVLPPGEWLAVATGVPAGKCAAAMAGGVSVRRDLLARPDCHDLLRGFADDNRLSPPGTYAWMAPTVASLAKEAALAMVFEGLEPEPTKTAGERLRGPARDEIAARYVAYLGSAMAVHENSPNFPLLLSECAGHTRPIA